MNQENIQKGKKVGADGLTKKERRALKVAAEQKDVKVENKPIDKTKSHGSEPPKLSQISDASKKIKSQTHKVIGENEKSASSIKPLVTVPTTLKEPNVEHKEKSNKSENESTESLSKKVGADGLTKKERRALKVAAEQKDVKVENKPIDKTKSHGSEPPKLSKISDASKKIKCQTPKVIGENEKSASSIKPLVTVPTTLQEPNVEHKEKSNKSEKESTESLSKAELKAQRRAIQEAQRLAKTNKTPIVVEKKPAKIVAKIEEKKVSPVKEVSKIKHSNKVALFNHLYLEDAELQNSTSFSITIKGVHPAFLKLGEQYRTKSILGSNARCLALLSALKCLVTDFKTPPNQEFYRCLDSTIQVCMSYISKCRPLAVSMTNAIKSIKMLFAQSELNNESDDDKRECVLERIDRYIQDDIGKAGEAISLRVQEKISNGDKPVLVCCENYKFSERAQTDSFVCNEIGDPEALVNINTSERSSKLANWSANKKLIPLNILYDVTPSDLVTAVVTEIAVLPCTSVPVILRIRPVE
ncbi:hypothetical protein FQR65_LT11871 [Abscondita terminalis]|nr:hypothetical protein FQR65_LT11871 [Abscondita terminalis]